MHRTEATYNNDGLFTDGPPGTIVESAWLNSVQEEICDVIEQAGFNVKSKAQDTQQQLYAAIQAIIVSIATPYVPPSYKERMTDNNGGKWYNIVYKDANEIIIKCKSKDGQSWIGARLNDGTYLELTSDYTIKYDTPGNAGHIIDGITATLANEWFIVWPYKNTLGTLSFGITWMPNTTCAANPTNLISPAQVNGQNIGMLFAPDSWVMLFEDTNEFEGPLGYIDAGAYVYDTDHIACKITSRTAIELTMGAILTKADFLNTTKLYQVNGFQPLQIDGAIASVIDGGYCDSGFRFRTDGDKNIIEFIWNSDTGEFIYVNGSGAASYTPQTGWEDTVLSATATVFRLTFCPPDKIPLIGYYSNQAASCYNLSAPYYSIYLEALTWANAGGMYYQQYEQKFLHGLIQWKVTATIGECQTRGYK
jgi:hypothetical protein